MTAEFSLRPFSPSPLRLTVDGFVTRDERGGLLIHFRLSGEIDRILFDSRSQNPARKDELWKKTCFECFLKPERSDEYIEINASPSGDWACYAFKTYRSGRTDPVEIDSLRCEWLESTSKLYEFSLYVPSIIVPEGSLTIGIALVLLDIDGRVTHWALNHPRSSPDFHDENGFSLKL